MDRDTLGMDEIHRREHSFLNWEALKKDGSDHYKTGGVEPVDLYQAGGMLRDFALCSIMKYAFRNRAETGRDLNPKDLDKIIDYAQKLKATCTAGEKPASRAI